MTSTNERDGATFRRFDCIGSVTGTGVVVVIVVVFVGADTVETIVDSAGAWIWFILVKSFFPRLAYGSRSDAARKFCWIIDAVCSVFCSCFGAWDNNVDEDDVTAGWVPVTFIPGHIGGFKVDAVVVVVIGDALL